MFLTLTLELYKQNVIFNYKVSYFSCLVDSLASQTLQPIAGLGTWLSRSPITFYSKCDYIFSLRQPITCE